LSVVAGAYGSGAVLPEQDRIMLNPSRRAILSGESAGKSLGWDIGERPRLSQKYDRPMATSMMGLGAMQ